MNILKRATIGAAVIFVAAMAWAAPASAQATRTWVSGVGDDVNPCSRTAPCKTFAGAISKTAAGGEINCLDPGGFGAVTITKSMTISCPYTEGGALAGGNGIVINDGATATPNTAVVYLRGLDIFGVNPPSNGVRFVAGAALHIEDSVIRRFNAANSAGVSFAPGAAAELFISNTLVADNGNAATGGGIIIKPGPAGNAKITLHNVRIVNNANVGFQIDMTGSTGGGINATADELYVSGNVNGVHALQPAGTSGLTLTLTNSVIVNNSGTGILGDGASATMRVGNTTIAGNTTGVNKLNASNVRTYGDNRLDGNTNSDGTFTVGVVAKE